jgi:hypothetical protein
MDARERLAYYKLQMAQGIALTAGQQSDMLLIIKERGAASSSALPASGSKHDEAKRKL